jgi:hypothetical protein
MLAEQGESGVEHLAIGQRGRCDSLAATPDCQVRTPPGVVETLPAAGEDAGTVAYFACAALRAVAEDDDDALAWAPAGRLSGSRNAPSTRCSWPVNVRLSPVSRPHTTRMDLRRAVSRTTGVGRYPPSRARVHCAVRSEAAMVRFLSSNHEVH